MVRTSARHSALSARMRIRVFSGALTATATFTVDSGGTLTQAIVATTDAPTVVNLTNHSN